MPIHLEVLLNRHADLISLSGLQNGWMASIGKNSPDLATLGGRLRARREALKLDQKVLAPRCGIKQSSLSDIESGKTKEPTARVIANLCKELALAWEYVVFGAGEFSAQDAMEQGELLGIYRALDETGRVAVLQSARAVLLAHPAKAAQPIPQPDAGKNADAYKPLAGSIGPLSPERGSSSKKVVNPRRS